MHNNSLFFITKFGIHAHQTKLVLGLILELKLFRNVGIHRISGWENAILS